MEATCDADLVQDTLEGSNSAFEELVRRWTPRVLAVCHARVGRAGAAEDLTQETLLRAFRALRTLSEPARFGAWLRGIAVRVCLDWLKSPERKVIQFSSLGQEWRPDEVPCPNEGDPRLDRESENRRLLEIVESLPEELREVVMLFYYQELKYRDIAEIVGVSAAAVNARLTRARVLLRERIERAERQRLAGGRDRREETS